jgi:lysophospholipase L1-like esterase
LRVLHYGDSPTTADLITSDVRASLQQRFGDAGHGFLLLSKPWAWYGHRGVKLSSKGWSNEPASFKGGASDRIHGLGGVSFTASHGATATVELPSAHDRVEIHFLRQRGGGEVRVDAGEQEVMTVSTAGEQGPGFESARLPAGTRSVKLTVTRGGVRMFGWSFERNEPGVVYSSIGLNGASVQTLVHHFEPKQWSEWLRHSKPDLIVINYGSNESENASYVDTYYAAEFRRLVERVRGFLPDTSVLVMSPMDRGKRRDGEIVTVAALPRIVDIQQETALQAGVAFFNTFVAMGGRGTMAEWYAARPRLVEADYLHLTGGGAAKVGGMLEVAILEGYERWKAGK